MEEDSKGTDLGNVIRIDDERVREHLGRIVRGTVEETLNAMLEAEADRLCNAERYERTQARRDQRSGSYERKLQTKAGEVTLKVPKLRLQTFETAIIERYRRRESSVEEALDRDVPGRRVGASRRGHHRGAVGHAGQPRHGVEPQQEDLRPDRGLAEPADRGRAALCLPRRHRAQAHAGRARCATCRCWWRSRSMPRAIGRSSASSRAPRRTRPAGAPSWPISRGAGCAASS